MENSKGFTIVEVVVVIGMIVVFSIIIISNFPQSKLQFALLRTGYKFEQDIRRVQSDAFSSTEYKNSSGVVQQIVGYGVYVDAAAINNKKYIIYGDISPGDQKYIANEDYIIETVDFSTSEPGVMIKQVNGVAGNKANINFTPPNPTTKISDSAGVVASSVDVVFAMASDQSKTKTVSVYSTGLIEVK